MIAQAAATAAAPEGIETLRANLARLKELTHSLDPKAPSVTEAEAAAMDAADKLTQARAAREKIGLFKTEVIHRRGPWRSLEAVEFATLEWVDWFNNRRLLEPIGNIPPAEAEANYYAQIDEFAMVA